MLHAMRGLPATPLTRPALYAAGRYVIFHRGVECGEERWSIEALPDGRVIATGEQEMVAPHPLPHANSYRVTLTDALRPTGLEIVWRVGNRELHALHGASDGRWRARIEFEGHAREQEGDYPDVCEVEYVTPLSNLFVLARRDFQLGGEHEFPVLRIGPPMMAVSPERMLLRCVERGAFQAPWGLVPAKRYVLSLPPRDEREGYTFWADENDFLLESYEGAEPVTTWMRLVELRRG